MPSRSCLEGDNQKSESRWPTTTQRVICLDFLLSGLGVVKCVGKLALGAAGRVAGFAAQCVRLWGGSELMIALYE
jgi:hypothetical protein